MSTASIHHLRRLFLLIFALVLACLAPGCGDSSGVGPTFPVSGKVTLDNEPVTAKTTIVLFIPDASAVGEAASLP